MEAWIEIQEQIDGIAVIGKEANRKALDALTAKKFDEYESNRADVEKYSEIARGLRKQMVDMKALDEASKRDDEKQEKKKASGPPASGEKHKEAKGDDDEEDGPASRLREMISKQHRPWINNVLKSDGFAKVAKGPIFRPEDTYHVKVGGFGHYVSDRNPSTEHLHETRALYTTGGDEEQGGVLIEPAISPRVLDRVLAKPLRILDVLRVEQTTDDVIEYYTIAGETNNADIVREWDTDEVPPNFGISPESDLEFDKETMNMKEIRTHIRASDKALRDIARLRSLIEGRLRYFVRSKLESEILNGDGTGDHFMGLMNWPGISNRTHKVSARSTVNDTPADTIALALTDLMLQGFEPNLILAHPFLIEKLRLMKDDNKQYMEIYDRVRNALWNVPFAISERMGQYTAIAGDFNIGATLYDRMGTEISVGQPGDLFLRRAWAIMATLMAGFVVEYPVAFERILDLNT